MDIYDELNVKKIINCAGTYTVIGGSRMSENTTAKMAEASRSHVDIRSLQTAVNAKIAEKTRNESACIVAGAMAGIYLTIASCISLKYKKELKYISKSIISDSEVIMFRAHRNPYDRGLDTLGIKLVELGYPNNISVCTVEEVEEAITDKTVAVLYLPSTNGGWVAPGALPFDSMIELAKKKDIPLIVDAAAQLPPVSNLWSFTEKGASAVLFSGGKDLCGPQSSGLILGQKNLLDWINKNNFPNYGIGRMLKVGREEIIGLYSAITEYLDKSEETRLAECEAVVATFIEAFQDDSIITMERSYPNEAGQPIPRVRMILEDEKFKLNEFKVKLHNCENPIFVMIENDSIYFNPMTFTKEESEIVIKEIKIILTDYRSNS